MGWRFQLKAIPSGEWIDRDLQLLSPKVGTTVSAPASISGSLPLGYKQLELEDGSLALREWGCMIIAQFDEQEPIAAIVDHLSTDGDRLNLDAGGFSMYPTGIPWLGPDYAGIQVDPLDMFRKVWEHVQSYPDGDLGVVVDATKSKVRIGTKEVENSFTTSDGQDVSFTSGPFRLAWWSTEDLGKVLDDLSASTPFQFRERSSWVGEDLVHRIELGVPTIGARKPDLKFEIGVNIMVPPPASQEDYCSEVFQLGAGEGRTKVNSRLVERTGRMRRVLVTTDKSLTSKGAATLAAKPVLQSRSGAYGIESVELIDHQMAEFGTFGPGDEIFIQGDAGWIELNLWVRIFEMDIDCDTGRMTLRVEAV